MTVSLEAALKELSEMFPEIDKEIIIVILRDNRGHLEKTIDNLLVLRGEKPINDEAFVREEIESQDEQIARDLQRKILVHDMIRERMMAERFSDGPGLFPVHTQRVPDDRTVISPQEQEQESDTLKEMQEKWNKLSEGAKLKFKEWWNKIKPTPSATNPSGAKQKYQQAPSGNSKEDDGDDDDEQVVFDSSLSRRLKPIPATELDVLSSSQTSTTTAAATTTTKPIITTTNPPTNTSTDLLMPTVSSSTVLIPQNQQQTSNESKKDK